MLAVGLAPFGRLGSVGRKGLVGYREGDHEEEDGDEDDEPGPPHQRQRSILPSKYGYQMLVVKTRPRAPMSAASLKCDLKMKMLSLQLDMEQFPPSRQQGWNVNPMGLVKRKQSVRSWMTMNWGMIVVSAPLWMSPNYHAK